MSRETKSDYSNLLENTKFFVLFCFTNKTSRSTGIFEEKDFREDLKRNVEDWGDCLDFEKSVFEQETIDTGMECDGQVLGWCRSNCGLALLNFAIWYWNTFFNRCYFIHPFNAHFFSFLLMGYCLFCIYFRL